MAFKNNYTTSSPIISHLSVSILQYFSYTFRPPQNTLPQLQRRGALNLIMEIQIFFYHGSNSQKSESYTPMHIYASGFKTPPHHCTVYRIHNPAVSGILTFTPKILHCTGDWISYDSKLSLIVTFSCYHRKFTKKEGHIAPGTYTIHK